MAEAAGQLPEADLLRGEDGMEAGASGAAPVLLDDRFRIHPGTPLADLDSPSAKAYLAEDRHDTGQRLFALICAPGLPHRTDMMAALRSSPVPGMLELVDYGVIDWPLLGERCMAIVFVRPTGGKLARTPFAGDLRIREHDAARIIVEPVVRTLTRLSARGLSHRAIRPNNMYFLDGGMQEVVLGECVTSPPGFDQPMVFETIERGMAAPGGRGTGDFRDDMYALGVSLAFLMLRRNPVQDHSPERIRHTKIERGSYAAICGNERLPMQVLEPVRGLLNDDPEDRWGFDDMQMWLAGARRSASPRKATAKAENSMMFGGREHFSPRTLAHAFSQSPADAVPLIRDGRLEAWLRRQLMNGALADQVLAAVEVARAHQSDPLGSDDYIVTKVCILLDPAAPIRYKGFSFMHDGFGPALAVEFLHHGSVQVPAEVLARDIPALWFAAQPNVRPGAAAERGYANLRAFLQNTAIGYGAERCLYEANPGLPCQSDLVIQDYATTPGELLEALEAASKRVDTKMRPMDRHIAAFIAARFEADISTDLRGLASGDDRAAALAMLNLFAAVQRSAGLEQLYGLASWAGGHLGPTINSYRNRRTRRDLERDIPRLVRQGSLPQLLELVDDPARRQEDEDGYALAQAEYTAAEASIAEIQNSDVARQETAEVVGQQTAAMASILLTVVIISVIFVAKYW